MGLNHQNDFIGQIVMKTVNFFVLIFVCFFVFVEANQQETGGSGCIACTVGMKLLQDLARKEGNIRKAVEVVCRLVPKELQIACKLFMVGFTNIIIREFEAGASPDRYAKKKKKKIKKKTKEFVVLLEFVKIKNATYLLLHNPKKKKNYQKLIFYF